MINKKKQITLIVDEKLFEEIGFAAKEELRSKQSFIKICILNFLKNKKKE